MSEETESRTVHQKKSRVIDRGKVCKALNLKLTVQLFKMIKKESPGLSKDKSGANEAPFLHNLPDHAHEKLNPFILQDEILSLRNC